VCKLDTEYMYLAWLICNNLITRVNMLAGCFYLTQILGLVVVAEHLNFLFILQH